MKVKSLNDLENFINLKADFYQDITGRQIPIDHLDMLARPLIEIMNMIRGGVLYATNYEQ